ncbi:TetR/AcrR family transcriptional regulator [Patulibacter sp.]|uniref:TetR/AcrR family transcriptional regulator n=1 Tax=Patulibacter sp. TaxID=1912859 RepID=UPI002716B76A|nr:TetR/AcrR family transcriptional regulator [Patulibacter sp.]MDO9407141.1 helix-turn-helix domain-containing protein [Patulibacter sp.]
MEIPPPGPGTPPEDVAVAWNDLDGAGKRARALEVAGELFAREGLDASMPSLAEAIGVGVGSIYRQIGRKEDVIAALVAHRIERVAEQFEAAADGPDPWLALRDVTHAVVAEALEDHVTHEAWAISLEHPEVRAVRPRASAALEALVERARVHGSLRPDAGAQDLRLAFRAAKEVEALGEGGAHRLADLVLRGMAADGGA